MKLKLRLRSNHSKFIFVVEENEKASSPVADRFIVWCLASRLRLSQTFVGRGFVGYEQMS
jgi:hypothetical protein